MYILIVGLFFHEEAKQTTLLHRQQTDEWKGNVAQDDDDIFVTTFSDTLLDLLFRIEICFVELD